MSKADKSGGVSMNTESVTVPVQPISSKVRVTWCQPPALNWMPVTPKPEAMVGLALSNVQLYSAPA